MKWIPSNQYSQSLPTNLHHSTSTTWTLRRKRPHFLFPWYSGSFDKSAVVRATLKRCVDASNYQQTPSSATKKESNSICLPESHSASCLIKPKYPSVTTYSMYCFIVLKFYDLNFGIEGYNKYFFLFLMRVFPRSNGRMRISSRWRTQRQSVTRFAACTADGITWIRVYQLGGVCFLLITICVV